MLSIQSPVSRHDSIKVKLSDLSWQFGLANFFIQNVPFSFSCGREVANDIVNCFQSISAEKPIHVIEIGAGTGILSKHVLDLLKIRFPDKYHKTMIHISDFSSDLTQKMAKLHLFDDHKGRFTIQTLNCFDAALSFDFEPDLIFFANLIDSTAAKHVEIYDGECSEILVKTDIPESASIINTQQYPPSILTAPEMVEIVTQSSMDFSNYLIATNIKQHLVETFSKTPFSHPVIDSFQQPLDPKGLYRFNFHGDMLTVIQTLLEKMGDTGQLFFLDFGYANSERDVPVEELVKDYGICTFTSIYFSLFDHALKNQYNVKRTRYPYGPQLIHISTQDKKPSLNANIHPTSNILKKIKQMSDSETLVRDVETAWHTLSDYAQESQVLLYQIAECLMEHHHLDAAKKFLEKCLNLYNPIAAREYTLMGDIHILEDNLDAAESNYKKALQIFDRLPAAFTGLFQVYHKRGNTSQMILTLKKILHFAQQPYIIPLMKDFATVYRLAGQNKNAEDIHQWIQKTETLDKK